MKRNGIVFGIVILAVAVVAIATLTWYGNKQHTENEMLYSPTMLSDSSFHVNLSDQSCMLVEIANDTMTIHTNNADMVGYKKDSNKVFAFCHDSDRSFVVREYSIDSILGTKPKEVMFDNH